MNTITRCWMPIYVDILLLLWFYHRSSLIYHYLLDFLHYFDSITMRLEIIFKLIDWICWFDIHKPTHHPKILLFNFFRLGFLNIFWIRFRIWDWLAWLRCPLTANLWKAAFASKTHVNSTWIFYESCNSNIWLGCDLPQLLIVIIFVLWFNRILPHSNACLLMFNSCIVFWSFFRCDSKGRAPSIFRGILFLLLDPYKRACGPLKFIPSVLLC